ncbi:thiol-disulfide oxidoreductase DCC family protein [Pollutibacter soli]|uniref:thiol-disulfide oxidoreductase DCC family protein n=1 Tax=Pollutibacter soli TaxID=3034157 RepID=UPI0030133982
MTEYPVILFDGVCNLCTASVQFVLKRDKAGIFRFASLQSTYGEQVRKEYSTTSGLNSFLLKEGDKIYSRSTAALRVAKKLGSAWSLLYIFIIVPPFIRNAVYDWVSANRYRWFGKKEECWVPTPELKKRFLS